MISRIGVSSPTARVMLAGDVEGREEYMVRGPVYGPLTVIHVSKLHTL
jgi:hypothetical protein